MKKVLKKCVIGGIVGIMCAIGSTGNAYSKKVNYNDIDNFGRCNLVQVTSKICYANGVTNDSAGYDKAIDALKSSTSGDLFNDMSVVCAKYYNIGIDDYINNTNETFVLMRIDELEKQKQFVCIENTTPEITIKTKKWNKKDIKDALASYGPELYKRGYLNDEVALNRIKIIISKENISDVEKKKIIDYIVYLYDFGKNDKVAGLPRWKMEMKMGSIKKMIENK